MRCRAVSGRAKASIRDGVGLRPSAGKKFRAGTLRLGLRPDIGMQIGSGRHPRWLHLSTVPALGLSLHPQLPPAALYPTRARVPRCAHWRGFGLPSAGKCNGVGWPVAAFGSAASRRYTAGGRSRSGARRQVCAFRQGCRFAQNLMLGRPSSGPHPPPRQSPPAYSTPATSRRCAGHAPPWRPCPLARASREPCAQRRKGCERARRVYSILAGLPFLNKRCRLPGDLQIGLTRASKFLIAICLRAAQARLGDGFLLTLPSGGKSSCRVRARGSILSRCPRAS